MWEIQTDLALENQERVQGKEGEIPGVILEKKVNGKNEITTTKIEIINEHGSAVMGKPQGMYLTIEFAGEGTEELENTVSETLWNLLPGHWETILIAGLGNADMTADALGPETVEKLFASRAVKEGKKGVAAIAPGVLAQTGMESAEIVAGVCQEICPDAVIVIDALAARSSFRLGKTIQITNTGILPGSGIGNCRRALNEESLGVPVIAVGVPTVVSAASIVCDALQAMDEVFQGQKLLGALDELDEKEKRDLVLEVLMPRIGNLYVAPKDMDDMVLKMSQLLSRVLNGMFA